MEDEVDQLTKKRIKLQTHMNALLASADELTVEAEATDKISFLRKAAKDKEQQLMQYDKCLEKKISEMKAL